MKRMALATQTYEAGIKTKKTTSFNQGQNDRWAASLFCDYGGDSGHNLKEEGLLIISRCFP
tara:strand:- start:801 stop:983 length:183 start_codon:yes stop_codon:yes gene_type:complete